MAFHQYEQKYAALVLVWWKIFCRIYHIDTVSLQYEFVDVSANYLVVLSHNHKHHICTVFLLSKVENRFKLSANKKTFSIFRNFPECFIAWCFSKDDDIKEFSQYSHLNGFSTLCTLQRCLMRSRFFKNDSGHC